MFFIVYKITNKTNNKYYIGMHKTNNINDGYMGSGKLIKAAIKKYGQDNFIKEILHVYDNEEDMKAKEKELVVLDEMSYNLCDGGKGGFGYINRTIDIAERNRRISRKRNYQDPVFIEKLKKAATGKKRPERKGIVFYDWTGKKHKEETKQLIGIKNSINQSGMKNSQYGTCWITNGQENKKIKKEELDIWIKQGYHKGRITV